MDYNEENDGTDESPTTNKNEDSQDETYEETTPELRSLQPPSTSGKSNDMQQKGNTWLNGTEPEEVSQSTGTTSMPSTEPTVKAPERIGFGEVGLGFMETPEVGTVPAIQ
jgi:hypothetical protein